LELEEKDLASEREINAPIKILLLGSDSNIGLEFLRFSNDLAEFSLTPCTQDQFNQADFITERFEQYDVVLDALSLGAKADEKYSMQIKACNQALLESDISMFMLSSVAVFSGSKEAAYEEHEVPDSTINEGKQLAAIEALVLRDDMGVVLRSGWLFGFAENDFVADTLASFVAGKEVSLQDDYIGNPTPISDLVRVAFSLIKQRYYGAENSGVYHYSCAEDISWFGFGEAISVNATQFNLQLQAGLTPINEYQAESSELTLLRRQSLSCRKIFNHFGVKQRPWRASLRNLVKELYQTN
jgi:dTDP-4-dehydrorhamnose reductase